MRVAFIQFVVGLRETVFLRITNKPSQDHAVDFALCPHRQLDQPAHRVSRFAKNILGHEIVTAPHGNVAACTVMNGIDRDIATRIACANNENPFVGQLQAALGG